MDIREFYVSVGGDYDTAMRVIGKESRIEKVLLLLPKDENMQKLRSSLLQNDFDAAFKAAHTLKGILLNLCLDRQAKIALELTEQLRRPQENRSIPTLFEQLEKSYQELICSIDAAAKLQGEIGETYETKKKDSNC